MEAENSPCSLTKKDFTELLRDLRWLDSNEYIAYWEVTSEDKFRFIIHKHLK